MSERFSDIEPQQGIAVDASDPGRLQHAIALALDYRGDVTVTRRSTGETVEGYLYDRVAGATPGDMIIRMMPSSGVDRVNIPFDDVQQIRFTGRDTAEGRSFETWMKKYVRKKLAGEAAEIKSEPLE